LFPQGRDLLHEGKCSKVRPVVDQIVSIMTVPLVQGTLRYAWKTGQIGGVDNKLSDQSAKNAAEGSTFAAAVLPLVHACNAAAAKTVSDNTKFGVAIWSPWNGFVSGTKPDTAAVKAALESTYTCLGITCAQVGGLLSWPNGMETGMETCNQPAPVFSCATHVVVDAYSVYTASSDPANPDGKVSCYWLDRSKYGCAGYAHLASEGQFAGMMRKCVNHPDNSQRCVHDDASAIQCNAVTPSPTVATPTSTTSLAMASGAITAASLATTSLAKAVPISLAKA